MAMGPTEDQARIDAVAQLLEIMSRLRDPVSGCPWDLEQTFETIVPHTIEEAYEVADTIERGAMDELKDELGDLLFQVVFYAQLASERSLFDFAQVAEAICSKMLRRHPHVFGNSEVADAREQSIAWERHKAEERRVGAGKAVPGQLAGVARALPALSRAEKLQKRAAKVGFDWPEQAPVLGKVQEELDEVRAVLTGAAGAARLHEEVGDLLFSCVNLARHLGVDAETALRHANRKFEQRFSRMEQRVREGGGELSELSLAAMDEIWDQVKQEKAEVRDDETPD